MWVVCFMRTRMPLTSCNSVASRFCKWRSETMAPAGACGSFCMSASGTSKSPSQGPIFPSASISSTRLTTAIRSASEMFGLCPTTLMTHDSVVLKACAWASTLSLLMPNLVSKVLDRRVSYSWPVTSSPCRKLRMYSSRTSQQKDWSRSLYVLSMSAFKSARAGAICLLLMPCCRMRATSTNSVSSACNTCSGPSMATAVSTSDCVVAHSGSSDTAAAAKGGSCSLDSLNSRVLRTSWNTYDSK
mmetsp:Transcript_6811/g.18297  ORF Transcript_6811/g.18297 Transcript_6811/m.18297 type:complete len:244 (-) Transcript_6811:918-1649(-)